VTYAAILVNLEAGRSNKHLLQVAGTVAERFEAFVIGSTACTPVQMLYGETCAYGEILEQDREEIEKETGELEGEFRAALEGRARRLGWRCAQSVPSLADHLATAARGADLILTSAASGSHFNSARQVNLGELLMQAGRPVLIVAPAPIPFRIDRVVIGWKDTREARRATADALPLLKAACQVSVIEIAAEDELDAARLRLCEVVEWLGRHGITADLDARISTGDDSTDLHACVDERQADIVIAGAYGHNRVREWAFGGVTRSLLIDPHWSAFVSH
jgi:nucleotide-binding universal stress UspA family protein